MNNVIKFIKINKSINIFVCIMMLWAIVGTLYINYRYDKDDFNYYTGYEDTTEYPWFVSGDECTLSTNNEHSVTVRWTENSDKIYLQMLQSSKGFMPTEEWKSLSEIMPGNKKIQFDCVLNMNAGQTVVAYIIQFDEQGERVKTKLEKVETGNIDKSDNRVINRNYSISDVICKDAKYYKVLFDLRAEGKSGQLTVSNMDVIFR